MNSFAIAIGRNINGQPMSTAAWSLFMLDAALTLERYGYTKSDILYVGSGVGRDTTKTGDEDSVLWVIPGIFRTDSPFATALRKIAQKYNQKEIAIFVGETIMLQADPTEGENDV